MSFWLKCCGHKPMWTIVLMYHYEFFCCRICFYIFGLLEIFIFMIIMKINKKNNTRHGNKLQFYFDFCLFTYMNQFEALGMHLLYWTQILSWILTIVFYHFHAKKLFWVKIQKLKAKFSKFLLIGYIPVIFNINIIWS